MHDGNNDLALLLHIARTQQSQGAVLAGIAAVVNKLAKTAKSKVDPALAEALAESKVHHDALKAALAAASAPTPTPAPT